MGYDIHITRADFWANSEGREISLNEWRRYLDSDPDIVPDPHNGPTDFLFVKHPTSPAPLWWRKGEVYSKNPDEPTIQKMIEIAEALGTAVQGDDGESYGRAARSTD
jgi:hypothetical protein